LSDASDQVNQTLVGWRGIEFLAPESLRLTAERIGPRSSYTVFSDRGYPRLELIIDRSRSYDQAGLSQWVDRLIRGKEASKWQDIKKSEAEIYSHKALKITGRVETGKFIAYVWPCSGRLNFVKLNFQQGEEGLTDLFRSLRCHRADGNMLISLYEFQISAPSHLWTSVVTATTGAFFVALEDENTVVLLERAGATVAMGMDSSEWLKKFHAKRLERYRVFLSFETHPPIHEMPHGATSHPIHPKGFAIRRKTIGITNVWRCEVNDRFWACSIMSFGRGASLSRLPKITVNCHWKKL